LQCSCDKTVVGVRWIFRKNLGAASAARPLRHQSIMNWAGHPETIGMAALQHYLSNDRKVIAWVKSAIIWNTSHQRTNAAIVQLNDPGADRADEQVPIATFTNAWHTGEESIARHRGSQLSIPMTSALGIA
jgi:hypothetical protein